MKKLESKNSMDNTNILELLIENNHKEKLESIIENSYRLNKISLAEKIFYLRLLNLAEENNINSYNDLIAEARESVLNSIEGKEIQLKNSRLFVQSLIAASIAVVFFLTGYFFEKLYNNNGDKFIAYDVIKINSIDIDSLKGNYTLNADLILKNKILKGNISDFQFLQICSKSIFVEKNHGIRLSLFQTLKKNLFANEESTKLIKDISLKLSLNDPNPKIRLEAIEVISKFPEDNDVKKALSSSFLYDENPAVRIVALNSLENILLNKNLDDALIVESLKKKLQAKDNSYVINRTKHILEKIDLK